MLIAVIVALALLALLNRRSANSFLYPPALFAGVWSIYLFLLWWAGKLFYQIAEDTLFFYFCGALTFSAGGLCCSLFARPLQNNLCLTSPATSPGRRKALRRVLDVLLILLLLALPWYWRHIVQVAAQAGISDLWAAIRVQMIVEGTENTGAFRLMDNLVVLALILALLIYYEDDGTRTCRLRTYIAAALAFVYTLTTATRSSGVALALYLLALHWFKRGRITRNAAVSFLLVFVLIFSGLGILVRKGEARPEASLTENVPALVDGLLWYSLGGIVAFDTVLHEPTRVSPTQSVFRPILVAGSKLGLKRNVPQLHAEYVPIGPGKDMNIYTMYFSYVPEFGVAGTMLVMFVLGAAITAVYWWARRGSTIATLMFSVLFAGIVLSAFAENLVSTMNFTAKLLIFTWVLNARAGRHTASRPSPIDRC